MLLKKSVVDFFNVACEKCDFRGAPEIRRLQCMISPGHPWPGLSRASKKEFFNALLTLLECKSWKPALK